MVHLNSKPVEVMSVDLSNAAKSEAACAVPTGILPAPGTSEQHFATDHLLANLRQRTIASGLVTTAAQGAKFFLNLAYIMVLARLLVPQAFGLVAMVTTVMGFLRIFQDAGLSTATVQRQEITHAQVSNLFWVNVAVGGIITLLVAASAPAVAWFYREPRLVGITLVLSITFLLASSTVQHIALLNRQMRFKVLAMIDVVSMLTGYLTGIGMALWRYGYWALVGANVMQVTIKLVLTWTSSRWRPRLPSRHAQTWHLLSFGANITAGSLMYSLARGADSLLIGRFFGAGAVGLYSRASILLMRPLQQFTTPINAVLVPALARIQDQHDRYRRTFLQVFEAIALMSFLFTGLLLALARPITLAVLGPKWEPAAVIFAGFTIAALAYPLTTASTWLFASQGRGKDWVLTSSIVSGVTLCSFLVGLPFGPAGVAISYSAACVLIELPFVYYIAGRRGPVSRKDLWIGCLRHLPVWGVVCSTAWLAHTFVLHANPWIQLFLCGPAALLAGTAYICISTNSRRVAVNLFSIIRDLKNAREAPSLGKVGSAYPEGDAKSPKPQPRRALWGLLDRQERWSLSWHGWLTLTSALVLAGALLLNSVYPFLATTRRVDADVLVVEGWIHEYAIRVAADEFRSGSYRRVFTTGGPVVGTGRYVNDFQTTASVGADLLKKVGVPDESLEMVPSRTMDRDRTYGSAIALRDWIREHQPSVRRINVLTENTHARRTWLLFQRAFGRDVQVGIIAVPNVDYPANRWWLYSQGLKDVVSESGAYLYARFLFLPLVSGAAVRYSETPSDKKDSVPAGRAEPKESLKFPRAAGVPKEGH
jgi:O-antigen/teichoic acid export membrane protein